MAEIKHEIEILAPIHKCFIALTTVSGLKSWHTAHIDGDANLGGGLTFKATEKPAFVWKVVEYREDESITWECLEGPGNAKGTKAIYTLIKIDDNNTLVQFAHTKWPHEEGHFRKCNTLWGILLHHLKGYLETGLSDPAFM